jgi:hypothetical protein
LYQKGPLCHFPSPPLGLVQAKAIWLSDDPSSSSPAPEVDHHVGVSPSSPPAATVAGNDDADDDDTPSPLAQRIGDCQQAIILEQTQCNIRPLIID